MTAKCCQAFTRNRSPRAGHDAMAIEMAAMVLHVTSTGGALKPNQPAIGENGKIIAMANAGP
jgi:hypothetical protein